jgi:hypothetical protein
MVSSMSPIVALFVGCRDAAIQSLSGEQRAFPARVRNDVDDPYRKASRRSRLNDRRNR